MTINRPLSSTGWCRPARRDAPSPTAALALAPPASSPPAAPSPALPPSWGCSPTSSGAGAFPTPRWSPHFLAVGTPAMTVTAFGGRTFLRRGRVFPAPAGADSARTEAARPPAEPEIGRRPATVRPAPDSEGSALEMAASPSTEEAGRRAFSAVARKGASRHETAREQARTRPDQPPTCQQPKARLGRIVSGSLASGLVEHHEGAVKMAKTEWPKLSREAASSRTPSTSPARSSKRRTMRSTR
jgi:hypothetical protein